MSKKNMKRAMNMKLKMLDKYFDGKQKKLKMITVD